MQKSKRLKISETYGVTSSFSDERFKNLNDRIKQISSPEKQNITKKNTNKESNEKVKTQYNNQSKEQIDLNQSKEQTDLNQSKEQTDLNQSKEQTDLNQSKEQTDLNNSVWFLTEKQAAVLEFLINKDNKITQLNEIVSVTGVKYGTVRQILNILTQENFISKPKRYKKGSFHGLVYNINDKLCSKFIKEQHADQKLNKEHNKNTESKK